MSDGGDDEVVTLLEVPFADGGVRIDAWLAAHTELSRSRVKQLIDEGRVSVDGAAPRASAKLKGGEQLVLREPPPAPVDVLPQDLPLAVVYEDDDILVINKAAGMAVHPGAGIPDGTVVNAVLHHVGRGLAPRLSVGGEIRPGIVHRLDKDTSGLLVVAKNDAAQEALAAQFAERRVLKRYTALCLGRPVQRELITGHRRADGDRRRFTTKVPETVGRRAHTRLDVVALKDGVALLDVDLLTGRTHQIRAHLADIGHPLLQDELYGGGRADKRIPPGPVRDAVAALQRQALHARLLGFEHRGTQLRFEAKLPADLQAVADAVLERSP